MNQKKPRELSPWQRDLLRAAEVIEDYASHLHDSYTVNGAWPDSDEGHKRAHREHDEWVALARRLRIGAVG